MAIVAWAAAASYPGTLAWLTVDDYDNRPRVFWAYVVAALRRAGVAVPRVVPGPGRVAVDHVFLARLASVLAAQDPPVVLVLDDLHLLTEPAVLDGLSYLLRNAGAGLAPRRGVPGGPAAAAAPVPGRRAASRDPCR